MSGGEQVYLKFTTNPHLVKYFLPHFCRSLIPYLWNTNSPNRSGLANEP